MIPRPDLLDARSPAGLEVWQLTTRQDVHSSHVYMEAQISAPDSSWFLVHESAKSHHPEIADPRRRYLRCDTATGELTPVTHEAGAVAPSVSPDGQWIYYFVDQTDTRPRFEVKRVRPDGSSRETLYVVDGTVPGTDRAPGRLYILSTIRADGAALAISLFLPQPDGPGTFGVLVINVAHTACNLIFDGPSWCNVHPQYCRQPGSRDLMIQENHGCEYDARGKITQLVSGTGGDIHVIRDDGTDFRNLPWGRDGNEHAQGHQCWRGRTDWAITSTGTTEPPSCQLIESRAVPHDGHTGSASAGGIRNHLSRSVEQPRFYHFATDIAGKRLITDAGPTDADGSVWLAELGEPGVDAAAWQYLLCPRSSFQKHSHIHPFLSPDGRHGFFNSDESGTVQAYMLRLPG